MRPVLPGPALLAALLVAALLVAVPQPDRRARTEPGTEQTGGGDGVVTVPADARQ
ncbi:hypothetical protein OG292_12765 [Streptomyces sp. NBC_01511]|uniref:hypothetical protein n=1 Tax=unclassified Streptomyces TaxID=2593676 RepID=UPI00386FABAC